jgi:hypothetical protein
MKQSIQQLKDNLLSIWKNLFLQFLVFLHTLLMHKLSFVFKVGAFNEPSTNMTGFAKQWLVTLCVIQPALMRDEALAPETPVTLAAGKTVRVIVVPSRADRLPLDDFIAFLAFRGHPMSARLAAGAAVSLVKFGAEWTITGRAGQTFSVPVLIEGNYGLPCQGFLAFGTFLSEFVLVVFLAVIFSVFWHEWPWGKGLPAGFAFETSRVEVVVRSWNLHVLARPDFLVASEALKSCWHLVLVLNINYLSVVGRRTNTGSPFFLSNKIKIGLK